MALLFSTISFYPKWSLTGTEATISWDVSGYYHYLPAIFIYQDLKELKFQEEILETYQPTPNLQQSFKHESGNYVMKYSCGQAIQMMPFFLIGHAYASSTENYKSDGYSKPYQVSITLGALLIAILGLIIWRRWLLLHVNDSVVALTILLIGFGSNYFEYAGITGAMTHNNLFMLYALLLWLSHSYYKSASTPTAISIGVCVGFMALTRPTEIVAIIIPLLYGVHLLNWESIKSRINFHKNHFSNLVLAGTTCVLIGSIQLIYWKYVSSNWLVYSYEDQGFSWLNPHIFQGLFSYNNGWIPYSPMMMISLLGLPLLYFFKQSKHSILLVYALLFIYIAFAWDIWWYGGSLGQRSMVQLYPVLSLPFALVIKQVINYKKWLQFIFALFVGLFIYINLWFVYQAHGGGMLYVEQMTKSYYWKTLGTWQVTPEHIKLLDNKDLYEGNIDHREVSQVSFNIPETVDTTCYYNETIFLSNDCEHSPIIEIGKIPDNKEWLRLSVSVKADQKEWNVWRMPQMILRYKDSNGKIRKTNMIRMHRFINGRTSQMVSLDSKIPQNKDWNVEVLFWNAEANSRTIVEGIKVHAF